MGVIFLQEALRLARERNLDLVQVTEKVEPPVCKIVNYGKYLYGEEKKQRKERHHKTGKFKQIRISFAISPHDMETKARTAEKLLRKGNIVRIEMPLRGREKSLSDFAKGKVEQFLGILQKNYPIKVERELKKEPKGFSMIVTKA